MRRFFFEFNGCLISGGTIIFTAIRHIDSSFVEKDKVRVSTENVLLSLGVPAEKAEDYLLKLINEYIADCMDLCNPLAACTIFNQLQINHGSLLAIGNHEFNAGKIVSTAFLKSDQIAVFIGTCGSAVENYSKRLINDSHLLEGLIVDIIGSEIAEGIAEYIHQQITIDMAVSGLKTTNRYSPGYCKWPVDDQQILFELMKDNNCGVHLNTSSLMMPVKSVSGIIGIGKNAENRGYACKTCDTEHCIYREKKTLSL